MLVRTVAGLILAPIFLAVLVALPVPVMVVMLSGIVMIASCELLRATGAASGHGCMYFFTAAAAGVVPFLHWLNVESVGMRVVGICLMAALFLVAIFAYGRQKEVKAESILFCLFGGLLIPVFMSSLLELRMLEHGQFLVLIPVVSSILTDVGAYFVGVLFGKHKGVTKVSPNKSAEGFAGGMLSGVVFMMAYGFVLRGGFDLPVNMLYMAIYGFVGSAVTMVGDLAFSLIKRQHGIKDYGRLIPGHGGMLDRFDSLIFTAPTAYVLVSLLSAV